jgi:hypothetical protein
MRNNNTRSMIHAGEAFGLPSIQEALRSAGPTGWVTEPASILQDKR